GAVRYSKPGGIVSCILSEITSDKEGYARYRLVVEDKGVGIPEEIKEHMFDLLEEGNDKLDVNDNSTRYGMSIVKRILDSMDGTIKIDSKIGKGTRVTIEIPLRIAEVK
ncbi:MAG TPA: hybrid sensor histidine kinase/response regulator, partial [Lachnospiraceae bacterium]|nr:hybrid sensor histidine kinase/response regulator [Lachnospiraceae bacterium]